MSDHVEHRGLDAEEAARRLASGGPNALPTARRRGWLRIIADAAHEPMFVLLFAGGLLYLLLGELGEGLLLFSLVLATLGLSLYQEGKTEKALAALRELSSPRAEVVRDGAAQFIDSREVVRGDLCVVREGGRVPADGFLVAANGVEADESLLTGEADAVRKLAAAPGPDPDPVRPGGHDQPFLYGGTTLVQGHGLLRVTATGAASAIGRIGAALQEITPGRTPLQRQVARLVTLFATGGAVTSVFLVLYYVSQGGGWLEALLAGIALALSLLPEEFAVVLAVFPALGAWRLARARVLTRRLAAIETLGTTSVLCVDKTGTLTENRMSVAVLAAGTAEQAVTELTDSLPEALHELLEYALLASPADSADPMDKAVQRLGQRALRGTARLHPDWEAAQEYGITAALRAVSYVWLPVGGGAAVVAAKGAPEAILDLCRVDDATRQRVLAQVDRMAAGGLRVLAVARATFAGPPWPADAHGFEFALLGLAGFMDPVREGVREAMAESRAAGMRVIMITGDYPATARHIARQAGIEDGEPVTGDELAALPPGELAERMRNTRICARVAPEQKLAIVRALKDDGEIVTMTGDGVNDAPALRAAHVGVAMGKRGTDVARQAASLVLLDDSFASLVEAVRRGRHIFANMQKAMAYIVCVHVPTAAMALVPVLLGWPVLLYPVHIVFLELLIDPTCALAFENEPAEPKLMRQPPRPASAPLLSRRALVLSLLQGVVAGATVALAYGWAQGALPQEQARSFGFAALVFADIALIFVNRSAALTGIETIFTPNRVLWLVCAGALAVLAASIYVPPVAGLFRFAPLPPAQFALACAAGLSCVLWFDLVKLARRAGALLAPRRA